jgi:hypothetical protein
MNFVNSAKMKCRQCTLALLSVLFLLAALGFAADRKHLSDAMAAVDANLKTAAGKRYDELMGKEFPERYLSSVKQCKKSAPKLDPFDLLLRLNAKGKVEEVLVYPETEFAICMQTALQEGAFSPPPHEAYWVNVHMEFKH